MMGLVYTATVRGRGGMVDAPDLKSVGPQGLCRFKSDRPHHFRGAVAGRFSDGGSAAGQLRTSAQRYGASVMTARRFRGSLTPSAVCMARSASPTPLTCSADFRAPMSTNASPTTFALRRESFWL
jgi:hypothetical protein